MLSTKLIKKRGLLMLMPFVIFLLNIRIIIAIESRDIIDKMANLQAGIILLVPVIIKIMVFKNSPEAITKKIIIRASRPTFF